MTKFVCPHCGKNERIIEYVNTLLAYTGQFNDMGEVSDGQPESQDCYTENYFCMSCEQLFDQPKVIEE